MVRAGFQRTTLPSIAGPVARLPPMAVKLNGLIATMNPFVELMKHNKKYFLRTLNMTGSQWNNTVFKLNLTSKPLGMILFLTPSV